MRGYLGELVRVLRPHGIAYFNIPGRLLVGSDIPPAAVKAEIDCQAAPTTLAPGQVQTLRLLVHNRSDLV